MQSQCTRLSAFLWMMLFITGCSSDNTGKIEGTTWSSLQSTVKGKLIPAGAVIVTFNKDGTMVHEMGGQVLSGRYSLGFGDRVTLNFDKPFAGSKVHSEKIAVSSNTLTMTDMDGTKLSFQRGRVASVVNPVNAVAPFKKRTSMKKRR